MTRSSKYYISCLNKNLEYQHFEVPLEVSIYVKQLEFYIKFPEVSKLKKVYHERFKDKRNDRPTQ